jgi:mannose-6-phosphate isomerase-like protein (cupin superfamily)
MHYHKIISETYKVLEGELRIFKYFSDRKSYEEKVLEKGESLIIRPGEIHINKGKETWVEVISRPGWLSGDYINIEVIMKKYLEQGQEI